MDKKTEEKKNWMERTLSQMSKLSSNDVKWIDFPKYLKFRLKLMIFIWDWFSWDAVKSGWKMPRLKFQSWWIYVKHPYLKKLKKELRE